MNPEIKVSVIVPIYNSEQYLKHCLDCILNQTLKEIEIICVDDGSTDSSPNILKEYQEKDNRIIALHQQNQFAGMARNAGKAKASGEYLVFWDSDDYFYPEALAKMYVQCVKDDADICVCNANQYLENMQIETSATGYINQKYLPHEIPFNRHTNPDYILNFTTAVPWNKMFRHTFIKKYNLNFQSVRSGNDIYFVINALCLASRITIVDEPLVCYRTNQTNSLIGTLSHSPLAPLHAWVSAAENLREINAFPEHSFANKAAGSILYHLHNLNDWDALRTAILFLQEGNLEKMSLCGHENNYYYVNWHPDCLCHLSNDSPEEFISYFSHLTYIQNKKTSAKKRMLQTKVLDQKTEYRELKAKYRQLKQEYTTLKKKNKKNRQQLFKVQDQLQSVQSSLAYRIGKMITWIPSKIKHFFIH